MLREWNMRDFTRMCKDNGFVRIAPYHYARCIGDGVYQTVYAADKQYIYPFSPEYSEKRKKANTISVGIWSLYARWDNILGLEGMYSPANLAGMRENHFEGFGSHCRLMLEKGFAFLNEITNQEKLLEARMKIDRNYGKGKWIHDCWLSAPLMVCGRWDEATYEVCRHYTHTWEVFLAQYGFLRNDAQYKEYFLKERECQKHLELTELLWHKLLVQDYMWLQDFLTDNLNRNTQYLQRHSVLESQL